MLLIDAGLISWGIFISFVGMAFFLYGRRRPDGLSLATGIVLMIIPYVIHSLAWSIVAGCGILAAFVFLKAVVKL